MDGYKELAAAVVRSACDDYIRCKRAVIRAKKRGKRTDAEYSLQALTRWFNSSYAGLLMEISPDILLKQMDEIAERTAGE